MSSLLPRSVKFLGFTSLLTDAASEAIYPLLPVFITRVLGGNPAALGVIEGAADATSSVLKILAGRWSDRTSRRKPFVLAGYTIAGLVRPLIAFATVWQHVFLIRMADRVGKGLRGAPRDAMLGALAPPGERGRVFGYHRAMDHAGAVIGPVFATAFLYFAPGEYRTLFALTIIPGLLAIGMLFLIPETGAGLKTGPYVRKDERTGRSDRPTPEDERTGRSLDRPTPKDRRTVLSAAPPTPEDVRSGWSLGRPNTPLSASLTRYLLILAVFTLGNSSDAFLLLRLSDAGLATAWLPLTWAGLHVIKSGLSTLGGTLSDRFGRRHLIIAGWALYAITYAGFAMSDGLLPTLGWFFVYGVHFALVEGSEKALVADLVPGAAQGAAFGWYNAVLGFGALGASLLFGFLWQSFGPAAAFFTGAGLAITASALLAADPSLASRS
jgi:MFS family permease